MRNVAKGPVNANSQTVNVNLYLISYVHMNMHCSLYNMFY